MKNISNVNLFLVTVLAFNTMFFSIAARAISLDSELKASLSVEVGLDSATRNLLASLPAEMRAQAVNAVRESLVLVDDSVLLYLNRVNEIISLQMAGLDCLADGATTRLLEQLSTAVKPWSNGSKMLGNLENNRNHLPSTFRWKTTTQQYLRAYADLLLDARGVTCASQHVPISRDEAIKIQTKILRDSLIFKNVEALQCSDPADCFKKAKALVELNITTADQRDYEEINALNRLKTISIPKKPGIFRKFDFDQYLNSLKEVYDIDTELRFMNSVRESKFSSKVNELRVMVAELSRLTNEQHVDRSGSLDSRYNLLVGYIAKMNDLAMKSLKPIKELGIEAKDIIPINSTVDSLILEAETSISALNRNIVDSENARRNLQSAMRRECDKDGCSRPERNRFCPNPEQWNYLDCVGGIH